MSFVTLNTTEITAGKPNKQDLWSVIKDNFDNHETRILALEATGLTTDPIQFSILGEQAYIGAATALGFIRIPYAIILTSAKLFIPIIGSSGTLEVDVYKSAAGGGAFSSIFSTKPSIAQAAGSYSVSSNGVLSVTDLIAGEILRFDTTQIMTGCKEAHLYVTYTIDS